MGESATTTSPTIPGEPNIIFPYYKDDASQIDFLFEILQSARITYTNGITSSSSQMSSVNGFIQTHINNTFSGTGMMVVDWLLMNGDIFLDEDPVSIPNICVPKCYNIHEIS